MARIIGAISVKKHFNTMIFRPAAAADLATIVTIYNYYVLNGHATFDTQQFTVSDRNEWFGIFSIGTPYQCWVAESDNKEVVGYAFSAPLRPRPAYNSSVETSIYLAPDMLQRGVGFELYSRLFAVLEHVPNLHRAYAAIAQPNPASNALHRKLKFRLVGTQSEVGYKLERYWDVSWFERELAAGQSGET